MLQRAGGNFPLTADVNFGASFGIVSAYYKSRASNIASTGTIRLASADPGIVFRNNANSGDLVLTTNSSDQLTYNGSAIAFTGAVNSGTQYKLGYYATSSNVISQNPNTIAATQVLVSDANGVPTTTGNGATTATEIGYIHGVTSALQTQLNSKAPLASPTFTGTVTIPNGVNPTDAAAFGQITASTAGALPLTGGTMSGVIAMGSNKITGLAAPTTSGDALAWGQAINGTVETLAHGSPAAPAYAFTPFPASGLYNILLSPVSAAATNWNTGNNLVTATNHGLTFQASGQLTTTGTLPAGLALATTYYVFCANGTAGVNQFGLANSANNAALEIPVVFTTQGTGTHTFTPFATGDLGVSVDGAKLMRFGQDTAGNPCVYIGPAGTGAVQTGQLLCVEGIQNSVGNIDVVIQNNGTAGARLSLLASGQTTDPNIYIAAISGLGSFGSFWSGGPSLNSSSYFQAFQGTTCFFAIDPPDTYFWSSNNSGKFHYNIGTAGTEVILITAAETTFNTAINTTGGLPVSVNDISYPSAILTAGSTTRGFLPPRMTQTQKNAIASPAEGLMVYDTTNHAPYYYNGTTWVAF